MKPSKWLALCVALQSVIVIAYLSVFRIFPEYNTIDFTSHLSLSSELAKGHIPPLSTQILYYGVEWYLALAQLLLPSIEPLVAIRWAMGLLVCISPAVVYLTSKEIYGSSKLALIASFFWLFGGAYLWFGAVFDSGIFANYLGFLASFLLVASVIYFGRKKFGVKSATLLSLALILALFSHFSTLLVFPPLFGLLIWGSIKSRKILSRDSIALLILLTPIVAGFLLFPNVKETLQNFQTAQPAGPAFAPALTWFASLVPVPSVQYMFAEIAPPVPLRWDLPAIGIFILLLSFLYQAKKEKNPKLWMLFGWFTTALVVAPFNELAWRYSFVALAPLTLMAPFGLYWLKNWLYIDRFNVRLRPIVRFSSPKALGCLSLITFLIFPGVFAGSWTTGVIYGVTGDNAQTSSDAATYQTIQWLKLHGSVCGVRSCVYIAPTDWRFTYSRFFGGPPVYIPLTHPFLMTPETVTAGAANFSADYVIVSRAATVPMNYCVNPGGQLIDLKVLNSTRGNSLKIGVSMQPRINSSSGPLGFFIDGQPFGRFVLGNGKANISILAMPKGQHDIRVRFGFTGSNVITVFMGEEKTPNDHGAVGNYCDPFRWYQDDWGGSARIVYQNDYVKIWCISNGCAP